MLWRASSRGTNPADEPLIGKYMEAIIDPDGPKAQKLLAELAQQPDGKIVLEDLNQLRRTDGFDLFGPRKSS